MEHSKHSKKENDERFEIITLEILSVAIENKTGLESSSARKDAGTVLDFFGYENRIIDNVLENKDRQLFYLLEEEGILSTDRTETELHDGKSWRTHYWEMDKRRILSYFRDEKIIREISPKREMDIYRELDDSAWKRETDRRQKNG